MTFTNENKAFVAEMIGAKKRLEDYPERYDPDLLMHEPASLPFGGTYKGLEEFKAFYPAVRDFYDFSQFELLGVYGDGDMVFATIKAAVAGSGGTIHIAEQFRFHADKLVEVRVHICDDELAARSLRRNAAVTHKVAEP
ncbi:MAG: nuclear transport factor 2 family protein [Sphingomonas sp.]